MASDVLPLFDTLAEEFLKRLRRGESVSIEQYAAAHPDLAGEILELFPALEVLERGKPRFDSAATALESTISPIPPVLGDYRIVNEVGRGGMGVVYEAEQCSLGRRVAVKVLSSSIGQDAKMLLRFRREARCAARLHHTNIVPVYEIGHELDLHFYTMQFIHGHGLHEVIHQLVLLRRGSEEKQDSTPSKPDATVNKQHSLTNEAPLMVTLAHQLLSASRYTGGNVPTDNQENRLLPPRSPAVEPISGSSGNCMPSGSVSLALANSWTYYDSVAGIGIQVADALAYAHEQGVLHRDIKPANLMIDVDGIVWLTDFGLAKEDTSELTLTGELLGTLKYMPPERFHGIADKRGDVFSLGLTLYELLTLRSDWVRGDWASTQGGKSGDRDYPPPRRADPGIPKDLETIVLKAIAAEPDHRYQSAEDLANDLRCFRSGLPILAQRPSLTTRARLWCRRNRLAAGMSVAASLLLVIAGLGWTASLLSRVERNLAIQARLEAQAAQHAAQAAEESALAREHLTSATSHRISLQPGSRHQALDRVRQAVVRDTNRSMVSDLRNEATAALTMDDTRAVLMPWSKLIPSSTKATALRGNPAEQQVAASQEPGDGSSHYSLDASLAALPNSPNIESIRRNIASQSELGKPIPYTFANDYQRCAVWDYWDSQQILIADLTNACVIQIIELQDLKDRFSYGGFMKFSPSSEWISITDNSEGGNLILVHVATGQVIVERTGYFGGDFSADGRWLALGLGNQRVEIIDLQDSASIRDFSTDWIPTCVKFNPQGTSLAIAYGHHAPVVDIVRTDNLERTIRLNVGTPGVVDLDWRIDGRDLVVARGASGSAEVWEVASQRRVLSTSIREGFLYCSRVDPSDRYFTTAYWGEMSRVWNLHTGQIALTFELGLRPQWDVSGSIVGSRQTPEGLEVIYLERNEVFTSLHDFRRYDESVMPLMGEFSPDGRWIAARMGTGGSVTEGHVAFWDATSRRLLATLNTGKATAISISSDGRLLSILHDGKLSRLPIQSENDGSIRIGPATSQSNTRSWDSSISRDGKNYALFETGRMHVYLQDKQQKVFGEVYSPLDTRITSGVATPVQFDLPNHPPFHHSDGKMSPDGRWVVTSGWHSPKIIIWDMLGVFPRRELQLGAHTYYLFLPDSRQLMTCRGDAYRLWDLKTLKNEVTIPRSPHALPGPAAVSWNGKLAALVLKPGGLDLVKLPSGERLLRLQRPHQLQPQLLTFSPDSSLLLEGTYERARLLGVWDLRQLNRQLADIGLDVKELDAAWKESAETSNNAAQQVPIPHLELIDCQQLQRSSFIGEMSETDARQFLVSYELDYQNNPSLASAANNLAWFLSIAPESVRETQRAVQLAELAMESSPNNHHRNTLGVACYRDGQFERAIELFEQNLKQESDDYLYDYYFLAMSNAAIGKVERAQECLRIANYLFGLERDGQPLAQRGDRAELQAFRAEATESVSRVLSNR